MVPPPDQLKSVDCQDEALVVCPVGLGRGECPGGEARGLETGVEETEDGGIAG